MQMSERVDLRPLRLLIGESRVHSKGDHVIRSRTRRLLAPIIVHEVGPEGRVLDGVFRQERDSGISPLRRLTCDQLKQTHANANQNPVSILE